MSEPTQAFCLVAGVIMVVVGAVMTCIGYSDRNSRLLRAGITLLICATCIGTAAQPELWLPAFAVLVGWVISTVVWRGVR